MLMNRLYIYSAEGLLRDAQHFEPFLIFFACCSDVPLEGSRAPVSEAGAST